MFFIWFVALFELISLVSPIVASSEGSLFSCSGYGAEVDFYHDYRDPPCPSIFHMDGKHCQATDPIEPLGTHDLEKTALKIGGFCDSYCQLKTTYTYGTEQPIDTQPLCRGPVRCDLAADERVGYSWRAKHLIGPEGWKYEVVDIAITEGYTPVSGDSLTSNGREVVLSQGECAYWTFIPFVKTTCGTYTQRGRLDYRRKKSPCEDPHSFGNICAPQPVEQHPADSDDYKYGAAPRALHGEYHLVRVDCFTGQKLLPTLEDDFFSRDGVSLPDDKPYMDTLKEHWRDEAYDKWQTVDKVDCVWKVPYDIYPGYTPDCIDALLSLRRSSDLVFVSQELTTVATWGACSVHAQLAKHANIPDCQFTYLELAIAAEKGRRECRNGSFGWCPVFPLLDKGNGCSGWVTTSRDPDDKCW